MISQFRKIEKLRRKLFYLPEGIIVLRFDSISRQSIIVVSLSGMDVTSDLN
jgi:hypothetical protein